MPKKMRAAYMTGLREIQIGYTAQPVPNGDEVLVRVEAVGICGSDLHLFEHGRSGGYVVQYPFLLGHEAAGTIVGLGGGVEGLEIGQRVALEPGVACGRCEYCLDGRYNLCPQIAFLSAPPYDGVFREYVAHPASRVFALPDGMDIRQGALVEPLAVAMHAVGQSGARPGQSAVVVGLGCIGQLTIMALQNAGVRRIFAIDILKNRLALAAELGAEALDASKGPVAGKILADTGGLGCDLVFETAGTPGTTAQTVSLARPGGTVTLIGMTDARIEYDFFSFICKELTLKSVFRYRHLYPAAIEAVAAGGIPLEKVLTREYGFDEIGRALNESIDQKAEIMKAVVVM